jgi:mRNA-degrading endonuclease toxin of MazEF toxin-antitoxin module
VAKANLGRRVAHIGPRRMQEVCTALAFALGCDG